ncbi:glycosyltransferase [Candidatus Rickettsiella viridis]|uniref:Glycosyltransferase n=1 Tax=Candidatus Rickettsiella viridis TaxID=676208 RepID=A0A2Z5UUA4_9COXI|nr:glycosyltransferase [Candidatus Rickettsiella viridis]BBB15044.1 glycosyltransferase [Candidatus Rickettsiella viridis]
MYIDTPRLDLIGKTSLNMVNLKNKRIFWLGAHKLLIKTELNRLRILGYEVFNPPYLSTTIDQSAAMDWKQAPSSLPKEAISILSNTNFFYTSIPKQAAEILNEYFGTVIVTINPDWLKNILDVYHGKVIYRIYGQNYNLSQYMINNHIIDLISEHEDFWLYPHSNVALLPEDHWLQQLSPQSIPYCLADDIIEKKDTWRFKTELNTMGMMCPRALDNLYYHQHYQQIKRHFSDPNYKVFGIQIIPVSDPQVMGTLNRNEQLNHFIRLRGFIYHYSDPSVCYLPPIEFMTLGGPVIFLKGSLLANSFNTSTPGEAKDINQLAKLAKQIQKGDNILIQEIIASQESVRMLYDPSYVWPIFDKAIETALTKKDNSLKSIIYKPKKNNFIKLKSTQPNDKSILIPFHKFGPFIHKTNQSYHCSEGIARVTRLLTEELANKNHNIIITSARDSFGKIHGFISEHVKNISNIKILIIENKLPFLEKLENKISKTIDNRNYLKLFKITVGIIITIRKIFEYIYSLPYVYKLNHDTSIKKIIIPHYFLFPEYIFSKKNIYLYLPDYLPHFYPNYREMGDRWVYKIIGKIIAKKAKTIFTNSQVTKNYLPNTYLQVKKEKIHVFPLPYLNKEKEHAKKKFLLDNNIELPSLFVFYPTRDRPSKRLSDFTQTVFLINNYLREKGEKKCIYGVLTTPLKSVTSNRYIIHLPQLPDHMLSHVYKKAAALLFTSENEGNFPTQITEALYLETPIIAARIPQITQELGEISNSLQLIDIGNCKKFSEAVLYTMDNREKVLSNQKIAKEYIKKYFSYEKFSSGFMKACLT